MNCANMDPKPQQTAEKNEKQKKKAHDNGSKQTTLMRKQPQMTTQYNYKNYDP